MLRSRIVILKASVLFVLISLSFSSFGATDPLPSWNEGPIKQRLITFVQTVTGSANPNYVKPEDRIATFDNDGTLWLEQPLYTQFLFAIDELKIKVKQHPALLKNPAIKALLSGNQAALAHVKQKDLMQVIEVTHAGMSIDQYHAAVKKWLETTTNKRFNKPYTALIYQPMLEVLAYLRDNHFQIYIVSGGGQEFIRVFAPTIYQVDVSHVIGTAMTTSYAYQHNQPVLIKSPKLLFVDDHAGKPEAINLFIGKKPIIAFGNSDGDKEMLEWTQSSNGNHMMLLVHHDDAEREYAYGPNSKVGTFSNALMQEAAQQKWDVISMKHDWKTIFPN